MIRYNYFLHGYHKLKLLANRELLFIQNLRRTLCSVLVAFMLTGCVQLEPRYQWQSFNQPLSTVNNSLVLVMLNNEMTRKKVEAEWVLALRQQGVDVGPGYGPLPSLLELNGKAVVDRINRHKLDTLLVVSIALDESTARYTATNASAKLADFVDQQLLLDADLFMQQRSAVGVQVAAFALVDQGLRWRSTYVVPVSEGGIDWAPVVKSAIKNMQQQGLRSTLKEKQQKNQEAEKAAKKAAKKAAEVN